MEWLVFWHWITLGLILIIAESLGAAGFLVALGMASITIGIITWMIRITWQWQLIDFSLLCLFFTVGWWQCLKYRALEKPTLINRPLESMLGRTVSLVEAIENGRGKIRVNDAHWFVTGPELPVGTKVKIVAVQEGTLLVVEPV